MKLIRNISLWLLASAFAASAAAQTVTNADIQRLQDSIFDASRDVSQARDRDQALGAQLQAELDDLRDETIYLKVKIRKNEAISTSELGTVRDKIADLRVRARGESAGRYSPPAGTPASQSPSRTPTRRGASVTEVPVGTEFDVRLQTTLSSATAKVEDRVEATTVVDLRAGDSERVLVPAGSVMRGTVESVTKAGRIERKGSLTVSFDRLTIRGRSYPIRATVTQALESEGIKGEAGKIGAGAGVGAVIGGILGGLKGAITGILIGGGGTIAATEGNDVELPAGTILRVRLDSGLETN
jgi:hypothetical protein